MPAVEVKTNLKSIPGPTKNLIWQSLFGPPDNILDFYQEMWQQYGDIFNLKTGPFNIIVVADAEFTKRILQDHIQNYEKGMAWSRLKFLVGNGLIVSEGGELWQRQRQLMQPLFTPKGVALYQQTIVASVEDLFQKWDQKIKESPVIDFHLEMTGFALSVIGRTMFDFDLSEHAAETSHALNNILEYISETSIRAVVIPRFIPTRTNIRLNRDLKTIENKIWFLINQRKDNPNPSKDLLTLLMNAKDEETGKSMSLQQLRDEIVTIFIAGHETTAQSLTWLSYLLTQNPEIEQKVVEEVQRVLGNRAPTVENLHGLIYCKQVVEEALRLYPPVWTFPRQVVADDEFNGYKIPARSIILLGIYLLHRHPKWWENPDQFNPDRFAKENLKGRPHYAYCPFGGGPRICLGNNLAMLEMVVFLAMLVQRYHLKVAPGQKVAYKTLGTLRPKYGMRMEIVPKT